MTAWISAASPPPRELMSSVAREVNRDTLVDQLPEIGPVFEVPGGAVHLVDNETIGFVFPEQLQDLAEDRTPPFCGGQLFFEPARHEEVLPGCEGGKSSPAG